MQPTPLSYAGLAAHTHRPVEIPARTSSSEQLSHQKTIAFIGSQSLAVFERKREPPNLMTSHLMHSFYIN